MSKRFYIREVEPDEERFETREGAVALLEDVRRCKGGNGLDLRVGEVLTRREREARDALIEAVLVETGQYDASSVCDDVCLHADCALWRAANAYREARR